jgi:hypothetical protein
LGPFVSSGVALPRIPIDAPEAPFLRSIIDNRQNFCRFRVRIVRKDASAGIFLILFFNFRRMECNCRVFFR